MDAGLVSPRENNKRKKWIAGGLSGLPGVETPASIREFAERTRMSFSLAMAWVSGDSRRSSLSRREMSPKNSNSMKEISGNNQNLFGDLEWEFSKGESGEVKSTSKDWVPGQSLVADDRVERQGEAMLSVEPQTLMSPPSLQSPVDHLISDDMTASVKTPKFSC